jgi:hypothetical protein
MEEKQRKLVRSYRLVFRRRWRIFRIQGWRIPLPGGVELRLLGYWLGCLGAIAVAARLPLLGLPLAALPHSLRLLALPLAAAWLLGRWEVDGRPPHRALAGLARWWLRPRSLAALRRCPRLGSRLAPLGRLALGPDLAGPRYPRGRLVGPARVLLRYPVRVEVPRRRFRGTRGGVAAVRSWRLRPHGEVPLHRGRTLEVPAGRTLHFDPPPR